MKKVFVTGADRGVGLALCKEFLEDGWIVYAGKFLEYWTELGELKEKYSEQLYEIPLDVGDDDSVNAAVEEVRKTTDTIDMLVNCAGISQQDTREGMKLLFQVNTIGPLRMTEAFLPLMETGMKRLCYVSSEAGCISLSWRNEERMCYPMTKSSLNMSVKLMFNQLQPKGFTFRLYHPGAVKSYMRGDVKGNGRYEPEETASVAYQQFIADKNHEELLIMTDVTNDMWPF